jgi:TPR repeat protein
LEAAMSALASLYASGIGSPRSKSETPFNLLRRAKSWDELRDRYECGFGTERDLFSAAECYCELALKYPNRPDLFTLSDKIDFRASREKGIGYPLETNDGRPYRYAFYPSGNPSDDVRRALSPLLKAATGDGKSASEIGDHYLKGLDAPKSAVHSWAWYSVAEKKGFADARASIKEIESHMTSEEMKDGEKERARLENELQRIAASL